MHSYYYSYQPSYPNQGWQCPQCARCYAPSVTMCWYCQPTTTTTSGTFIQDPNTKWETTYTNHPDGER